MQHNCITGPQKKINLKCLCVCKYTAYCNIQFSFTYAKSFNHKKTKSKLVLKQQLMFEIVRMWGIERVCWSSGSRHHYQRRRSWIWFPGCSNWTLLPTACHCWALPCCPTAKLRRWHCHLLPLRRNTTCIIKIWFYFFLNCFVQSWINVPLRFIEIFIIKMEISIKPFAFHFHLISLLLSRKSYLNKCKTRNKNAAYIAKLLLQRTQIRLVTSNTVSTTLTLCHINTITLWKFKL